MKTHLVDKFPNQLYSGGGCDFRFPERSGERFWYMIRSFRTLGGDASCEQAPLRELQLSVPASLRFKAETWS